MLVTKDPIRYEVPHEPGEWLDLIKLSWTKLKEARRYATLENAETARAFGAELVKALATDDTGKAAEKLIERQQYHESSFDTKTLLLKGIVGWSYEAELSAESVAELDDKTVAWAKQAIIDLTKPPTEEDRKNS